MITKHLFIYSHSNFELLLLICSILSNNDIILSLSIVQCIFLSLSLKWSNNDHQIPEETETFSSTTSENGSVPKTEVEVLPFKVIIMISMISIVVMMSLMVNPTTVVSNITGLAQYHDIGQKTKPKLKKSKDVHEKKANEAWQWKLNNFENLVVIVLIVVRTTRVARQKYFWLPIRWICVHLLSAV